MGFMGHFEPNMGQNMGFMRNMGFMGSMGNLEIYAQWAAWYVHKIYFFLHCILIHSIFERSYTCM